MRLVEAAIVPGQRVMFLKAKLDNPFQKGEELVFEPDGVLLGSYRLASLSH